MVGCLVMKKVALTAQQRAVRSVTSGDSMAGMTAEHSECSSEWSLAAHSAAQMVPPSLGMLASPRGC